LDDSSIHTDPSVLADCIIEKKNITMSSFYDHDHDDDLDRFWKKKKNGSNIAAAVAAVVVLATTCTVRFSTIHVRGFNLSHELDAYEQQQQQQQQQISSSKRKQFLRRPSLDRLHLLKQLGYSRNEINDAALIIEKFRKQRLTRDRLEYKDSIP